MAMWTVVALVVWRVVVVLAQIVLLASGIWHYFAGDFARAACELVMALCGKWGKGERQ